LVLKHANNTQIDLLAHIKTLQGANVKNGDGLIFK